MDINIKVKDKIAVGDETLIVCGNSDYTVNFELDAEWASMSAREARGRRLASREPLAGDGR